LTYGSIKSTGATGNKTAFPRLLAYHPHPQDRHPGGIFARRYHRYAGDFILPESYSSMARIKVERDQSDVSFLTDPRMGVPAYDPYFIQNEFETIKSERVLTNVVANLNLNDDWGKKYNGGPPLKTYESVARLRAMMDLQPRAQYQLY